MIKPTLAKDFRDVKVIDKNITLSLKGFKESYNIENTRFNHVEIKNNNN